MRTYTTTQGDMWDSIAFQQMGSVDYFAMPFLTYKCLRWFAVVAKIVNHEI